MVFLAETRQIQQFLVQMEAAFDLAGDAGGARGAVPERNGDADAVKVSVDFCKKV